MNKDEKRWIVLLVAVLVIAVVLIVGLSRSKKTEEPVKNNEVEQVQKEEAYVEVLEDGSKVNTSNKLKENKEFNGLEISNIEIVEKDNETILEADVTNQTNEAQGDYGIYLKIKDDKGNEIKKIAGYINYMGAKEKTRLSIKTSYDFANAYDFEIEKQ